MSEDYDLKLGDEEFHVKIYPQTSGLNPYVNYATYGSPEGIGDSGASIRKGETPLDATVRSLEAMSGGEIEVLDK